VTQENKAMTTTPWTYKRNFAAWLGNEAVTIPDQIADNQRHHDEVGTVFPALRYGDVSILVRLDGEAYRLHTTDTGDCRVKAA
jgi:hypothetical protein